MAQSITAVSIKATGIKALQEELEALGLSLRYSRFSNSLKVLKNFSSVRTILGELPIRFKYLHNRTGMYIILS